MQFKRKARLEAAGRFQARAGTGRGITSHHTAEQKKAIESLFWNELEGSNFWPRRATADVMASSSRLLARARILRRRNVRMKARALGLVVLCSSHARHPLEKDDESLDDESHFQS